MFPQSEAGFRRLLPLLKPHSKKLIWGGLCMLIYVACWPLLAWIAGELIPKIGEGEDFSKIGSFLLSKKNKWITGQILHIDGGRSTLRIKA